MELIVPENTKVRWEVPIREEDAEASRGVGRKGRLQTDHEEEGSALQAPS